MDVAAVLELLFHGNQLKRTPRTGWIQRGVANAENVATHSYGVVFTTLVLAELVEEDIDLGKALAIAALHDLPEGLTTDIPTPAWRHLPTGIKTQVERGVMAEILDDVPFEPQWMALWEELHRAETAAARLVHDADKLDMFLQALVYEEQTGNLHLEEFWQGAYTFFFREAQAIYEALRARRKMNRT